MGFTTGGAAGPAIAGLVVAAAGAGAALWLDAATFAATAIVLATAPGLRLESDRSTNSVGRLRAGLHEIAIRPHVQRLIVAFALILLFGAIAVPIEVIFAKRTLGAGDAGYGALLGAWGAGMIVGGALFAVSPKVRSGVVLAASAGAIAAGYAGLAASPDLMVACAFSALGGIGNGSGWVAALTAIQEAVPVSTHSAVMAVIESLNQVMPAVGFVAGGVIASVDSPRGAYLVAGVGVAVVLAIVALVPSSRPAAAATSVGEVS
jgi:MFS family permease